MAKPEAIVLSHQRSGTHFLQASLASHPAIHARDECLMHLRKAAGGAGAARDAAFIRYDTRNAAGKLNLAIVMYSQIDLVDSHWGRLNDFAVIHLVRDAHDVAHSFAQMEADKRAMGESYRPHYAVHETPHQPAAIDLRRVGMLAAQIRQQQDWHRELLGSHERVLEIGYEELTGKMQTNQLAEPVARRLLAFLGLPYRPLTNYLKKTGSSHTR